MFTGIITAVGTIKEAKMLSDMRVVISCPYDPAAIAIGASIACSGVCLTVVERGGEAGDSWFAVDVSGETVACTASDQWVAGRKLNLEQALKLGEELGGHIVTGHVDAVGTVESTASEGGSTRLVIRAGSDIAPYIAAKGSITLSGVSLTVNDVTDEANGDVLFALNIIPHTGEATTLGQLVEGGSVNLEIDVLARYLQRMQALKN